MTWNADNTVWTSGKARLRHLGNGEWEFRSEDLSSSVETDGGSEDSYAGKLTILWESGQLQTYYNSGNSGEHGTYSGSQTGTYTFTGNGPASIRIGYSYPWNGGSGSPTRYNFTETTISNGRTDNRCYPQSCNYGTSDVNFGIDIAEINPDNPAVQSEFHTIIVKGMDANHNVLAMDSITIDVEAVAEPEPWVPVQCQRTIVGNPGSGFTSIDAITALFPTYGQWPDVHGSYGTEIYFGNPAGELDADGRLVKICGSSNTIDVHEDNDGPSSVGIYVVQDPDDASSLELWVSGGANIGWSGPGWSSTFSTSNPGPNLQNKIYAYFSWSPRITYVSG